MDENTFLVRFHFPELCGTGAGISFGCGVHPMDGDVSTCTQLSGCSLDESESLSYVEEMKCKGICIVDFLGYCFIQRNFSWDL